MSYPPALARFIVACQPVDLHRDGSQWKCRCPAHRDLKSSLSIKVSPEGKLALFCHAGCTPNGAKPVLDAYGVGWEVLFPDEPAPNGSPSFSFPSSPSSSSTRSSRAPRGKPEAVYDYVDESGSLLFQVCRYPDKDFRQRRPQLGGTWAWNLNHTRRVLYHLDKIAGRPDDVVWVCEGEKDANRLDSLGLLATTNPGGAGKWRREYSEVLRGRRVILVPDQDPPATAPGQQGEQGQKHMEQVAESLSGTAAEVATVVLEDVPEHGDVSDWLDAGHTLVELEELAEKARSSFPHIGGEQGTRNEKRDGWLFVGAAELLSEEDDEPPDLVAGLLPEGGVSVIGAKPKAGKSTLARCLMVAVAQGREFLGRQCRQGPVLYLAMEEKRREAREHLRELGMKPEDPVSVHFGLSPKEGLRLLAEEIERRKPVLCVVDTLFKFARVRDTAAYAEVQNALEPVLDLARRSGCHMCLVHHNTKIEREGGDDLLGSTAIFGGVDTALILRRRANGMRFAYSVQRYATDLPNTVLRMDGPWVVAAGELEPHEINAMKDRIVEFLAKESPAAEMVVRENVEGKTENIVKALRQLVNDGAVGRSGTGKRGDPYMYSLVALEPTTPAARDGVAEVCPACGHPERDIVTGSGHAPSWRCLGCGQLYGQLVMNEENGGNEKVEQNEEVTQDGGVTQDGENVSTTKPCPRCGSTSSEERGFSPVSFRRMLRCLSCSFLFAAEEKSA